VQTSEKTPVGFMTGNPHYNLGITTTACKFKSVFTQEIFMGIKTGPKPIAKSTGKEDKRQRVTPENKPKHPGLKEHDHKKGE
jgi:hypothetical protein